MPEGMNAKIALQVRNAVCMQCKMSQGLEGIDICRTAEGNPIADVLVVSKYPLGPKSRKELHTYLEHAGFDVSTMAFTGAVKCLTWEAQPTKTHVKACKSYLDKEISIIKPKWILALGNEALQATLGKTKITEHRGRQYPHPICGTVVPTISPASIYRNPGQKAGFEADLSYCHKLFSGVAGGTYDLPSPLVGNYHIVDDQEGLRHLASALDNAEEMYFDIEATGFDEFDPNAKMISLALTTRPYGHAPGMQDAEVWVVPLWHPQSVWRNKWQQILAFISRHINKPRKRIAHNGKYDNRWLTHFGCYIRQTFDTMLASHLLDEDRPKGIKPLARTLVGADPWDIHINSRARDRRPWWEQHTLDEILWYNALDTWNGMRVYDVLLDDLLKEPRLAKVMAKIMMPASAVMVASERHGVWADRSRVIDRWAASQAELDRIDGALMEWVPDNPPHQPNFNPSNFARWLLFDHLELPVLARGKSKENGDSGDPSMAEAIMQTLQEMLHLANDERAEFVDLMLERTKWQKYTSSFFSAYAQMMDDRDYVHTTFKLTGTRTGRLSSGKPDADKITGVRKQDIRGVNMQQVPRDEFVRGVFGAPSGFWFVEADYSQIELRVAAFLAQEPTMLHLYNTGQDIHMAMAMRMTGKPASEITKEERKRAKAVNFGFLYGMGWFKFVATAWSNYGIHVSEEESKAFRRSFFDQFRMLPKWHAKQRSLVDRYGYVVSPFGRIRHLPDIRSRDRDVRAEAERQAINSPVQSFASDMALWSMVRIQRRFDIMGLKACPIGTVHDAINFEVPEDEMKYALPVIKETMEDTDPLKDIFGIDLNVPIIADVKVGHHWGGATELTPDQVYNWDRKLVTA